MNGLLISISLILIGIGMYISNISLITYYLNQYDPRILMDDTILPNGEYRWEQTAGMGIIPRWVSIPGLLCYPIALLGVVGVLWYLLA